MSIPFQVCRRCLYSTSHPLGLTIDDEGICSGCRIHEEKDTLDWDERWDQLEKLVKPYRSLDHRNYDCIVPVTGAGDSFYILHLVKQRLKLNPLLVSYNRYYNTEVGIKNLARLRIQFDCDILIQNVNPISKESYTNHTTGFRSFHWPVLAGQSAFPVQTAINHKIPLIIWGAHQGVEQVGMFSHLHEVEMTRRYRKDHDILGAEADDLLKSYDYLTESDIWQYRYPDDFSVRSSGIRGIYLSNFVRWDPVAQHRQMVKTYGFVPNSLSRTFDIYDHVDDVHYMGLHDYIKTLKVGYGKVLDQACREIRHGRISRQDAELLVEKYSSVPPPNIKLFSDWLGIKQSGLNFILKNIQQKFSRQNFPQCKDNDVFDTSFDTCEAHIIVGKGYP